MHKLKRATFTVIVSTYDLDTRSKVDAELQAKHEIAMNITQYVMDNATQQADPIGHRGTMIKGDYFVVSPNDLEAYVQRRINALSLD